MTSTPEGAFAYGTLTRAFPPNPKALVPGTPTAPPKPGTGPAFDDRERRPPSASSSRASPSRVLAHGTGDESDLWRQKQLEISELQTANRTLLRRSVHSSTPKKELPPAVRMYPPEIDLDEISLAGSSITALSRGAFAELAGELSVGNTSLGNSLSIGLSRPVSPDRRSAAVAGHRSVLSQDIRSRDETRVLADENSSLKSEIDELKRARTELKKAVGAQSIAAKRCPEVLAELAEAERQNCEMADEVEKLQKAKAMLEQLQGVTDGVAHKTMRNFIEHDLSMMKMERRNAEALLKVQVKKWTETAERLETEGKDTTLHFEEEIAHLRRECDSAVQASRRSRENAIGDREEAHEAAEHLVAEAQLAAAQAEMQAVELRSRVDLQAASLADDRSEQEQRYLELGARARNCNAEVVELRAELEVAAHRHQSLSQSEQASDKKYCGLEERLRATELEASSEKQMLQEHLEKQQVQYNDERKKLRREAGKKLAEQSQRCEELQHEAEAAAAKLKDAERDGLSKLSNARQERQKAETKLKNQLQALRSESQVADLQREQAAAWEEVEHELPILRKDHGEAEMECQMLRRKLYHAEDLGRSMRRENESSKLETAARVAENTSAADAQLARLELSDTTERNLRDELALAESEISQNKLLCEREVLQARSRCQDDIWTRLSAVEERHGVHLAQAREANERELLLVQEQVAHARDEVQQQMQAERSVAEQCGRMARVEQQMVAKIEVMEVEHRKDKDIANSADEQYKALLDGLRQEREHASLHFQQQLKRAEEKRRELNVMATASAGPGRHGHDHDLPSGATVDDMHSPDHAHSMLSTTTCESVQRVGPPLSPRSPTGSAHGGFGLVAGPGGANDVDQVLRSIGRQQEKREMQRLQDAILGGFKMADQEFKQQQHSFAGDSDKTQKSGVPAVVAKLRKLVEQMFEFHEISGKRAGDQELVLKEAQETNVALQDQFVQLETHHREILHHSQIHIWHEATQVEAREADIAAELATELLAACSEFDAARQEEEMERARADGNEELAASENALRSALMAELADARQMEQCMESELVEEMQEKEEGFESEMGTAHSEVKHELEVVRRSVRRELTAVRDEQGDLARSETRAESQAIRARSDRAELDVELRETKQRSTEGIKELQSALHLKEKESRRELLQANQSLESATRSFEAELAGATEEESVCQARLSALEESVAPTHRKLSTALSEVDELGGDLKSLENEVAKEKNCLLALRERSNKRTEQQKERMESEEVVQYELEQQHLLELDERHQAEQKLKDQLRTVREDKMKERGQFTKQAEQMRSRCKALEAEKVTVAKQREKEVKDFRTREGEQTGQLEKLTNESQRLGAVLQNSLAAQQAAALEADDVRGKLLELEYEHDEAQRHRAEIQENHAQAEAEAAAWRSEHQSVEGATAGHMDRHHMDRHRLEAEREQLLENQVMMQQRNVDLSEQASEARETVQAFRDALSNEVNNLAPLLSESDGFELQHVGQSERPPREIVLGTFQIIARHVAVLARECTELRHRVEHAPELAIGKRSVGSKDNSINTKIAMLQKEVVKLREENQMLKQHQKEAPSGSAHSSGGAQPVSRKRTPSPAPRMAATANAAAAATPAVAPGAPKPLALNPSNGASHSDTRARLKTLQAEKHRKEVEIQSLKVDMGRHTSLLQAEVDRLQASLWEEQQQREGDDEKSRKKIAQAERRVRILEDKLQDRTESQRLLESEKDSVEEQLSVAARQLETLLADESQQGDLQKDLSSLSQQFELLHGKHRIQLTKAAEQGKALQKERDHRRELEEQLRDVSGRMEEAMAEAVAKYNENMSNAQETMQSLRKRSANQDRELQDARTEQASLTVEASTLRGIQQQQALTSQELQDEVQRLQTEVETKHQLLVDAREKNPNVKDALKRLEQKEADLDEMRSNLRHAEVARQKAVDKLEDQTAELEAIRSRAQRAELLSDEAREDAQRTEEAVKRFTERGGSSGSRSLAPASVASSTRLRSLSPDGTLAPVLEEDEDDDEDKLGGGRGQARIRTAQNGSSEWSVSSGSAPRRPGQGNQAREGLLSALDEIQETLASRERVLWDQKSDANSAPPSSPDSRQQLGFEAGREARQAADCDVSIVTADGRTDSPGAMQRDLNDFARSIDFRGDLSRQMAGGAFSPGSGSEWSPETADVRLKVDDGSGYSYPQSRGASSRSSPTNLGGAGIAGSSYPSSPGLSPEAYNIASPAPSSDGGGNAADRGAAFYPRSPREEGWLSSLGDSSSPGEGQPPSAPSGASRSPLATSPRRPLRVPLLTALSMKAKEAP